MSREQLIVWAAIAGIAVLSNPGKEQYREWLTQKVEAYATDDNIDSQVILTMIHSEEANPVDDNTKITNLRVCTYYETEVGWQTFRVLGLFRNFILLQHASGDRPNRVVR